MRIAKIPADLKAILKIDENLLNKCLLATRDEIQKFGKSGKNERMMITTIFFDQTLAHIKIKSYFCKQKYRTIHTKQSNKIDMPQIAIMNYADCSIDIINISAKTWNKYVEDFDVLVYDVMGYHKDEVYYMTGSNLIKTRFIEEDQL